MKPKWILTVLLIGMITCLHTLSSRVLAGEVDNPAGEGIIQEIYLPFPHDANNKQGYRITRTGWLYKNDYDQLGIPTKPDPVVETPSECPTIASQGNKFCFTTAIKGSEYHDSTEGEIGILLVPYQRGSIDIGIPYGSKVTAATQGEVVFGYSCGQGGENQGVVRVRLPDDTPDDDSDNRYIEYRHLSTASVTAGTQVEPGDKIGNAGSCGIDTGAHLHIAVFDPNIQVEGQDVEIEIRFLDRQARMIHPEGLPIPQRSTVTGQFFYVADNHEKPDEVNYWPPRIQFRTPIRFLEGAEIYAHNLDSEPPYTVITRVDLDVPPIRTIGTTIVTGRIIQAPINWGGVYPYKSHNNTLTWWYIETDDDETRGWVEQTDLSVCLSDVFCDLSPYDQFYPYTIALYDAQVTSGCATVDGGIHRLFCGYDNLQRWQLVAMAERWLHGNGITGVELNEVNFPPYEPVQFVFPDLAPGQYDYEPGLYALHMGFRDGHVWGYSTGLMKPTSPISRWETLVIIMRALMGDKTIEPDELENPDVFEDINPLDGEGDDAGDTLIVYAYELGITDGQLVDPNNPDGPRVFLPNEKSLRVHIAKWMCTAFLDACPPENSDLEDLREDVLVEEPEDTNSVCFTASPEADERLSLYGFNIGVEEEGDIHCYCFNDAQYYPEDDIDDDLCPLLLFAIPDVVYAYSINDFSISDDSSTVAFATENDGVLLLDTATGQVEQYTVEDGLPGNVVQNVAIGRIFTGAHLPERLATEETEVWISTTRGVARFVNGLWYSYPEYDDLNIRGIEYSPDGEALLLGGREIVVLWNGQELERIETLYKTAVTVTEDGEIFGAKSNGLVYQFDGQAWQRLVFLPGDVTVTSMEYAHGRIYFGTDQGLIFYQLDSEAVVTLEPEISIASIEEDANGFIWVFSEDNTSGVYGHDQWLVLFEAE